MTSYPAAPGAKAVILNWVVIRDDERSTETEYVRTKILTEEGKNLANVELQFIDGFSRIENIEARTVHSDGTIVPFNGKTFDKTIVKAFRTKLVARTFSLPDVRVGDIIEYRYTRSWRYETLLNTYWTVQKDLPVVKAQFRLKPWTEQFNSFFAHAGLPAGKKPERIKGVFELDLENLAAFQEEPFAPSEEMLKPNVNFFYKLGDVDADAYWNEIGTAWGKEIESFIGKRKGIRTEADTLLTGMTKDDEKLRKLYRRVQDLRNLTYETKSDEELKREKLRNNRNVEDVLRNGYGYRVELNRLYVALARAAGFEAMTARVRDMDENFARVIPDSQPLDNELAVVILGGKPLYLDPGTPFNPYGMLPWRNSSAAGLRITAKGDPEWIETPFQDATSSIVERNADLRLEGDVLKGTVKLTYLGQEALLQRLAGRAEDETATRKRIEDEAKKWFPEGSLVKMRKLEGAKGSDEPLVATLDVDITNLATLTESRILLPMSVFAAAQKNPFASEKRKHPVMFEYANMTKDRVSVQLPSGYRVEDLPKPVKIDLGGIGYTAQWNGDNKGLTLERTLRVDTTWVGTEHYNTVRGFFSRVVTADQEPLVLKKDAKSGGGTP